MHLILHFRSRQTSAHRSNQVHCWVLWSRSWEWVLYFQVVEKNFLKNTIKWHMKTLWNLNLSVRKSSFIGIQSCLFIIAGDTFTRQSRVEWFQQRLSGLQRGKCLAFYRKSLPTPASFYKGGNWGTEKLRGLSKVAQLWVGKQNLNPAWVQIVPPSLAEQLSQGPGESPVIFSTPLKTCRVGVQLQGWENRRRCSYRT